MKNQSEYLYTLLCTRDGTCPVHTLYEVLLCTRCLRRSQHPVRIKSKRRLLRLVHTADTDKTRLSSDTCPSAVWTELATKLKLSRNRKFRNWTCLVLCSLEMRCELSFVLSRPGFQFATVQSQIYWRLLKTVLSCRQLSSHRRHGQDKTRQSCLVRVGGVN